MVSSTPKRVRARVRARRRTPPPRARGPTPIWLARGSRPRRAPNVPAGAREIRARARVARERAQEGFSRRQLGGDSVEIRSIRLAPVHRGIRRSAANPGRPSGASKPGPGTLPPRPCRARPRRHRRRGAPPRRPHRRRAPTRRRSGRADARARPSSRRCAASTAARPRRLRDVNQQRRGASGAAAPRADDARDLRRRGGARTTRHRPRSPSAREVAAVRARVAMRVITASSPTRLPLRISAAGSGAPSTGAPPGRFARGAPSPCARPRTRASIPRADARDEPRVAGGHAEARWAGMGAPPVAGPRAPAKRAEASTRRTPPARPRLGDSPDGPRVRRRRRRARAFRDGRRAAWKVRIRRMRVSRPRPPHRGRAMASPAGARAPRAGAGAAPPPRRAALSANSSTDRAVAARTLARRETRASADARRAARAIAASRRAGRHRQAVARGDESLASRARAGHRARAPKRRLRRLRLRAAARPQATTASTANASSTRARHPPPRRVPIAPPPTT